MTLEVVEGTATENGAPAILRFTRTGSTSSSLTINVTREGTSTATNADFAGDDGGFFEASNLFIIGAGQVFRDLELTASPDNVVEAVESLDLSLASGDYTHGSASSVSVTFIDDPPVVSVTAIEDVARENGSPAVLRFARSGGNVNASLQIDVIREGTTTVADADFSGDDGGFFEASNLFILGPGQPFRDLVLTATPDNLVEGEERFDIAIADGSYVIGSPPAVSLRFVDDSPVVTVTAVNDRALENGAPAILRFARSGGNANRSLQINVIREATTTVSNADFSGDDGGFFEASNLFVIGVGQPFRDLVLTATPDAEDEGEERLDLLIAPGSYVIGTPGGARIVFADGLMLRDGFESAPGGGSE